MTLDNFIQSAYTLINNKYPDFILDVEKANALFYLTNLDYFKEWSGLPEDWKPGQPIARRGWQVSELNSDALRPFLVTVQNQAVTTGSQYAFLAYPSNLVHVTRMGYFDIVSGRQRAVVFNTDSEVDDALGDPVIYPTTTYPIYTFGQGGFYIYPGSIQNITISYLRLPATPVYAVSSVNGVMQYDSGSSTQFEWNEPYHNDLLNIFLKYIALAAEGNLTQMTELKIREGV